MKLNNDCIRDVLLMLEKEIKYTSDENGAIQKETVTLKTLDGLLIRHTKEDIFYTLKMLDEAGYIDMKAQWTTTGLYFCNVSDITFRGHELLEKIRDDQSWNKVKAGTNAIRNYSLDAITAIANGIASAAVSAYLEKITK